MYTINAAAFADPAPCGLSAFVIYASPAVNAPNISYRCWYFTPEP